MMELVVATHIASSASLAVGAVALQILVYSQIQIKTGSVHLQIERFLIRPSSVLITLSGIALWSLRYSLTSPPYWLLCAVALWIAVALAGVRYFGPGLVSIAMSSNQRTTSVERAKWLAYHWVLLASLLGIGALMTVRPGS